MTSMTIKKCCREYSKLDDIRKLEVFAIGQVWASYDEEDMPRNHALIIKIKIHESPIRMFINWMKPAAYINWMKPAPVTSHKNRWYEALPVVCGLFNVERKQTTMNEPTSFSHMVTLLASDQLKFAQEKVRFGQFT